MAGDWLECNNPADAKAALNVELKTLDEAAITKEFLETYEW